MIPPPAFNRTTDESASRRRKRKRRRGKKEKRPTNLTEDSSGLEFESARLVHQDQISKQVGIMITSKVILLTLVAILAYAQLGAEFRCSATSIGQQRLSMPTREPSTTTTPASSLEDPKNSETSESSGEENVCFRCYDQVRMAQRLIAVHEHLGKRQKKLLRQKHMAPQQANFDGSAGIRKPRHKQQSQHPQQTQTTNKTQANHLANVRNRTLMDIYANEDGARPIVVSRLRVARSTNNDAFELDLDSLRTNNSTRDDRESALKKLKHKREQQRAETCKLLQAVQSCLDEISRDCIGDLQFHSLEVFSKQWFERLVCPPARNPNFKPYAALTRSIPKIEEPEKVPIPRMISSPEEVQKRLDAMFGGGKSNRLGVMLKPTLTSSASQKFDSFASVGEHYRDPTFANDISERKPDSGQIVITSQLLLIPCFLILGLLIITLISVRGIPPKCRP